MSHKHPAAASAVCGAARYDQTGRTYSQTRRPDPRVAAFINQALHDMVTVANVGAGTGSYEPPNTVIAIEPSPVMIAQRPPGAAPVVRAAAENLPIGSHTVDAALAILTVHHWSDLDRGITEMLRITRHRIVILTWDDAIFRNFWLLRDYLPAAAATNDRLAVPLTRLTSLFGKVKLIPVPVPRDCTDGFGGAYWSRPHAYLDPAVQAGMSMLALTPKPLLLEGLSRLKADLATGEWSRAHADLLDKPQLDLGYRLVVGEP